MAAIAYGTMLLGKIDKVGKQSIQTKFFLLGIPLFPIKSYYCLADSGPKSQAFPIRMNARSVAAGFIRLLAPIFTIIMLLVVYTEKDFLFLSFGLLGIALFISTFLFGMLSDEEKERRQLLIEATGIGADPKVLFEDTAAAILSRLEEKWAESDAVSSHRNWRLVRSLSGLEKHLYPLLYSLARYAGEAEQAEQVWENYKRITTG
ncbi:MAG: hypothetical protein JXA25_16490 [Anaerolineales bacterium]|nr:hypothetical protein [Anaerolineales bacterium]